MSVFKKKISNENSVGNNSFISVRVWVTVSVCDVFWTLQMKQRNNCNERWLNLARSYRFSNSHPLISMGNSHGHHHHHRKNRNEANSYFPHQTPTPTPPPFKFGPSDHHQHQPAAQFQNNSTMSLPYAHVDCSLRALAGQAEGFGRLAIGGLHGPLYHVTTLAGNFTYVLWGLVIIAYLACLIYESRLVFLWFVKNLFCGFEV